MNLKTWKQMSPAEEFRYYEEGLQRQEFIAWARETVRQADEGGADVSPEVLVILREVLEYDGKTSGPVWHEEAVALLDAAIDDDVVGEGGDSDAMDRLIALQLDADEKVDALVDEIAALDVRRFDAGGGTG